MSDSDGSFSPDDDSFASGGAENNAATAQGSVSSLKSALKKREAEVKDLKAENKRLKSDLAKALISTAAASPTALQPLNRNAAKEKAEKIKGCLSKMLSPQLVYKKSLKGSKKGSRITEELPDVSEEVAAVLLGKAIKSGAQTVKGAEKLQINVPGKSMRYNGYLGVAEEGMNVTWEREGSVLKVSGFYRISTD